MDKCLVAKAIIATIESIPSFLKLLKARGFRIAVLVHARVKFMTKELKISYISLHFCKIRVTFILYSFDNKHKIPNT